MSSHQSAFQITVDCADADGQARFWGLALHYDLQEPPPGHETWRAYWLSVGVPEEELGDGDGFDAIVDPTGGGPRIWFQQVPEHKSVKNRLHFDLLVGGGRAVSLEQRRAAVDNEVKRLVAAGAAVVRTVDDPVSGHYHIAMVDPEGNEFDVV